MTSTSKMRAALAAAGFTVFTVFITLGATWAGAQEAQAPSSKASDTEEKKVVVPKLFADGPEAKVIDDKDPAALVAKDVISSILGAYNKQKDTPTFDFAQKVRRTADAIADESIAKERDEVLDFLGISPQSDSAVYFFVSWSMPQEMLRSYAIEAMWSGGTLVFKGAPPGRDIMQFVVEDLRQLVFGKGAAANISIDPRLYDAYRVDAVPAIVFTTVRDNLQCQGLVPVEVSVEGKTAQYQTCPALNQNAYWKVSGAVTAGYALDAFIEDGALKAKPFRAALGRGFAGDTSPAKEQKAYQGKWEDVLSPSVQLAAQKAAQASASTSVTTKNLKN